MSQKDRMKKNQDLFTKRAYGHLATLMPDGSPQVTPVWVDYDGEYILVNSARGRVKDRNIQRDPRVAIEIQDPDDPYRYIQIRGRVVETTTEGAEEHIDKMAKKYTSRSKYGVPPGEVRVIFRVQPD
jgi:PPOX class probable F420-dependent enzyme